MFEPRDMPNRSINKSIEKVYDKKRKIRGEGKFKSLMDVAQMNQYLLDGPIIEDEDPLNIYEKAHNRTLADMKEDLLQAVNKRRAKVLTLALEIFNKVQDQTLNTTRLNSVEKIDERHVEIEKINENLTKFDALLNDERSPIHSTLSTMAQYKGDDSVEEFEDYFNGLGDFAEKEFDVAAFKKETDLLNNLNEQIYRSQQAIRSIQGQIIKESNEREKFQAKQFKSIYDESYNRWDGNKKNQFKNQLEKRIHSLYQEYKETLEKNKDAVTASELSSDDKLSLLRDIFTVEYDDSFTNNIFPEFYSQDLIIFGIENNIAEAVRLGEKMMS